MSKLQKTSERQAAQAELDEQIMRSAQLQQVWTKDNPLVLQLAVILKAPSPDGDVMLGCCAINQEIAGVMPDDFRCQGNWSQFLASISALEIPIHQACMQGCQQLLGDATSLLANTLLIQGASVPTITNPRLAVTRPAGFMSTFGTSKIPILRSLASVECGIDGHEHIKTREIESQICEAVKASSIRKGVNLLNRCQGRTGDNAIPTATAHRVIKAKGIDLSSKPKSVGSLERKLELSTLASEAAQANCDAALAVNAIARAIMAGCDANEALLQASEAVKAAREATDACRKAAKSVSSNCDATKVEQELAQAREAIETALKAVAETKSAVKTLEQNGSK